MINILATAAAAAFLASATAEAAVYAVPDSFVSLNNSSVNETLLAGDAVFTGTRDDVSGFSEITCISFSDVDGATSGFSLELSMDGTNWDRKKMSTAFAGQTRTHTLAVVTKFFRVVYTNGVAAQSEFRLQCLYHKYKSKHLTTSTTETISDQTDVEMVRVSSTHLLDVSRGVVRGHFYINVFGFNPDVGSTEEFVWETGGDYTGFLLAPVNIEVVSDSALDDDGSAGAHRVTVVGLDENFELIQETIDLNGLTPNAAVTETSWIRVTRIFVFDVGTYATTGLNGSNIGTISVNAVSAGPLLAEIVPQKGESGMAFITIPAGVRCSFINFFAEVTATSNREATLRFWRRRNADDVVSPFTGKRRITELEGVSGVVDDKVLLTVIFQEKTDLYWTAVLSGSGSNSGVNINWKMICYPNFGIPPIP